MKLAAALAAIAPALKPTARLLRVPLVVADGKLSAYNGHLSAIAPIDDAPESCAVDGEKFARAYVAGSTIAVAEKFVTISRGKVRFRLAKLDAAGVVMPDMIAADTPLTAEQLAVIRLAEKFVSTNALHPWACAVNVTRSGCIATNNQILVFVPCRFEFEAALPFWALDALPDHGFVGVNPRVVSFRRADGVRLQAARLSEDMPEVVGRMAAELAPAADRLPDVAAVLAELTRLDGRYFVASPGAIAAEGDNGEMAEAEIAIAGLFKTAIETAKLVFSVATHIDFTLAPGKLRFSKDTEPRLYGVAAGMR